MRMYVEAVDTYPATGTVEYAVGTSLADIVASLPGIRFRRPTPWEHAWHGIVDCEPGRVVSYELRYQRGRMDD